METSSIWEEHLKSFGTIFFLEWTYFTPVLCGENRETDEFHLLAL